MSVSYQLSSVVFGGLMPMAGAGLLALGEGSPIYAIGLMILLVLINITGVLASLGIIKRQNTSESAADTNQPLHNDS